MPVETNFIGVMSQLETKFPGKIGLHLKPKTRGNAWIFFYGLLSICSFGWVAFRIFSGSGLTIISVAVSVVSTLLASKAITMASRRTLRYKRQVRFLQTGKPYILFLRSFRSDDDSHDLAGVSKLEADVVSFFGDQFAVVAIDNTSKPAISAGAARVWTTHDIWREAVSAFSTNAVAVIIDGRHATEGLIEEIESHLAINATRCENVIVTFRSQLGSFTENKEAQERIRNLLQGADEIILDQKDSNTPVFLQRISSVTKLALGPRKVVRPIIYSAMLNTIRGVTFSSDEKAIRFVNSTVPISGLLLTLFIATLVINFLERYMYIIHDSSNFERSIKSSIPFLSITLYFVASVIETRRFGYRKHLELLVSMLLVLCAFLYILEPNQYSVIVLALMTVGATYLLASSLTKLISFSLPGRHAILFAYFILTTLVASEISTLFGTVFDRSFAAQAILGFSILLVLLITFVPSPRNPPVRNIAVYSFSHWLFMTAALMILLFGGAVLLYGASTWFVSIQWLSIEEYANVWLWVTVLIPMLAVFNVTGLTDRVQGELRRLWLMGVFMILSASMVIVFGIWWAQTNDVGLVLSILLLALINTMILSAALSLYSLVAGVSDNRTLPFFLTAAYAILVLSQYIYDLLAKAGTDPITRVHHALTMVSISLVAALVCATAATLLRGKRNQKSLFLEPE